MSPVTPRRTRSRCKSNDEDDNDEDESLVVPDTPNHDNDVSIRLTSVGSRRSPRFKQNCDKNDPPAKSPGGSIISGRKARRLADTPPSGKMTKRLADTPGSGKMARRLANTPNSGKIGRRFIDTPPSGQNSRRFAGSSPSASSTRSLPLHSKSTGKSKARKSLRLNYSDDDDEEEEEESAPIQIDDGSLDVTSNRLRNQRKSLNISDDFICGEGDEDDDFIEKDVVTSPQRRKGKGPGKKGKSSKTRKRPLEFLY